MIPALNVGDCITWRVTVDALDGQTQATLRYQGVVIALEDPAEVV
jgi:ribosomal protein L19